MDFEEFEIELERVSPTVLKLVIQGDKAEDVDKLEDEITDCYVPKGCQ